MDRIGGGGRRSENVNRRAMLRASDAEREQVAERLRRASVEGRLQSDELEERMSAALSAKTYGELDAVVSDLPAPMPARLDRRTTPWMRRPTTLGLVALTLVVLVVGAVVSAIGGHSHSGRGGGFADGASLFWLVWIVLGWRYFSRRHGGARWGRGSDR